MSTEKQFLKWLRRKDKTFCENLQFAIKAWKSSEFTLSSKYDIILNWVAEEGISLNGRDLPIEEFTELLQLRAQPAQISLDSKRSLLESVLNHSSSTTVTRIFPELLHKLIALEWMQDLLRTDYVLTARMYGRLFSCYEAYINENELESTAHETNFVSLVIKLLKEQLQNSGDLKDCIDAYDNQIVEPLTQVLLVLRTKYNIDFFDEVRDLERTLREDQENLVPVLLRLPMHSAMYTLECVIANRRMDQKLLLEVFHNVFVHIDVQQSPSSFLLRAACVLDLLRKHNVLLNFEIDSTNAMSYLGARIHEYVDAYKETHLREVLLLLCVVLRLNPLILEHHVFQLTTWMIVAPKDLSDDGQILTLFQEYLTLLLDMFRRLSRAEKFVVNLLKALKEWLSKNQLQPTSLLPKKFLKRKLKQINTIASKQTKMEDGTAISISFSADIYVEMLFHDFCKQLKTTFPSRLQNSFVYLHFAWPSAQIGILFSNLIASLVSKASMTIWKTLLYSLKDQLFLLKNDSLNLENTLFRLDFHSALLCQYFAGARPTEQYEKYFIELTELRKLTGEVLSTFGNIVLERPFHKRTMNAFLECAKSFANFELLLAYYKPDGLEDKSLEAGSIVSNLHGFLDRKQWSIIKECVINSGNNDCLSLFDGVNFQLVEAKKLLENSSHTIICFGRQPSELSQLLESSTNKNWIISNLKRGEKKELIRQKMQEMSSFSDNFLYNLCQNSEMIEILSYTIFENLCRDFGAHCKPSLLANIDNVIQTIDLCSLLDHQEFDKAIKTVVGIIVQSSLSFKIKKLPHECVANILKLIPRLPLGHLRRQTKSLLFALFVAFYQDLKNAQADSEAEQIFDCLTDLLHFGQQIPIFRYFKMTEMLHLLPIADCWDFYKFLFSTIKNEEKGTDEFLKSLEQLLSQSFRKTGDLCSEECRLLVLAIESLNALSGQIGRRIHKHLHEFLIIYGDFVYKYFEKENITKKDKKFVEKTLAGFAPFIKSILVAATSTKTNDEDSEKDAEQKFEINSKTLKPLDENLRRICKIYIGHSMNYRNPYAIQLTQVALKNRKLLHLDLDEIELILNTYWRQLNAEINQIGKNLNDDSSEAVENCSPIIMAKTTETLVKMIIENKTNEDFLLTLKNMGSNMIDEQSYMNVIELLTLVAKSNFSTIKGAIFNEQFKQMTGSILLRLKKSDQQTFTNEALILRLLGCQQACVENRTIPLTPDTLDTILGLLIEINIKKYPITDTNLADFYLLHSIMTSLCSSVIKHRHILLMDRVAQFLHIFKDLLQAIVLYKSDRQKDTSLNSKELNELAELALKLEILMHTIATHKTDVKRVAPFVLIFAINLLVSGKRPTTLYPKIKTHIEAICYSLIGISDHRVGRFILRCSSEAARQTYELLVKDHEKYHKFKGKV